MKREYSFNARLQCVTDFGNALCLGRVITKSGVADQLVAGPNRINNLGKIWGQRNHSLNLCRYGDFSSRLIDDLPGLGDGFQPGRLWSLRTTQQAQECAQKHECVSK